MDYRTILVHADDSPPAAARIALAISIAKSTDAHLVGVAATGVSRFLYPSMPPDGNDTALALHLGFLREQSQQALTAFTRLCETAGLASFEARLIDDEPGGGISLHGRAADLIVLGQADPAQHSTALLADLPAYVVMNAGRPVLMTPWEGHAATVGQRVLMAWDASREAARAMQQALPFLHTAAQVEIAVFDTGADNHLALDAGAADPVVYLGRHGVKANLTVHKVEKRRGRHRRHEVGEALLTLSENMASDLLVMGAYGHSRLRETILGGVTRTVFEAMTTPVLMAH